MSWEVRGNHRRYTRSTRRDGRIVREYVGTGPVAQLAAEADRLERAAHRKAAEARRAERVQWGHASALERELEQVTDHLVRAALAAAGYRRHGGEWRRRRNP